MDPLETSGDKHPEFGTLIEEIRPKLCAFLLSLTGNRSAADDLTQESCLVLWEKREEYRPEGNFQAWAFQIAFYQVQNYRRKLARQVHRELPGDALLESIADAASDWGRNDQGEEAVRKNALLHCLAKLKEPHRELLLDRYVDDRPLKALASSTGITSNAMAQKLFRIKRSLLGCIEKQTRKQRKEIR